MAEAPLSRLRPIERTYTSTDFIGTNTTWQLISSTSQYDRERIPGIPNDREVKPRFTVDKKLNQKISLWRGDITCLRIDAIVNSLTLN
ncbi:hypothetical protein GBAR_LOCUS3438 [Geodia barretti]|uniref:Uncharacterized protein n=1 Tax=Geodia barretti TaxID=519541 RepID=A0AA35R3B8_GEOBA|nr:hypothetical protein GBAR_LOCUS3438 [Geodia barretti]